MRIEALKSETTKSGRPTGLAINHIPFSQDEGREIFRPRKHERHEIEGWGTGNDE
jgi:hypothetical protein